MADPNGHKVLTALIALTDAQKLFWDSESYSPYRYEACFDGWEFGININYENDDHAKPHLRLKNRRLRAGAFIQLEFASYAILRDAILHQEQLMKKKSEIKTPDFIAHCANELSKHL